MQTNTLKDGFKIFQVRLKPVRLKVKQCVLDLIIPPVQSAH